MAPDEPEAFWEAVASIVSEHLDATMQAWVRVDQSDGTATFHIDSGSELDPRLHIWAIIDPTCDGGYFVTVHEDLDWYVEHSNIGFEREEVAELTPEFVGKHLLDVLDEHLRFRAEQPSRAD